MEQRQRLSRIVTSRDGAIALRLTLYEGTYPIPNRIAEGMFFSFERVNDGRTGRVGVMFSDMFQFAQPEQLGLPADVDPKRFQFECAVATIGEHLDRHGLLPPIPAGENATMLECFNDQIEEWVKRSVPSDDELLNYIRSVLYWSWKCDLDIATLEMADSIRWHVPPRTTRRVAQIGEGDLWTSMSSTGVMLRPTATFIRSERDRRKLGTGDGMPAIGQLLSAPRYAGPAEHWRKAEGFALGENRDLANAAKESVCAVEGLARIVTGDHVGTLGDQIKTLKAKHGVNAAMAKTLEGIWGFTSNSPGVRHGGATPASIDEGEAHYVVQSCEAALRYLLTLD
jgi:hypothetical protein